MTEACAAIRPNRHALRAVGDAGTLEQALTRANTRALERATGTRGLRGTSVGSNGGRADRGVRAAATGVEGPLGAELRGARQAAPHEYVDAAPLLQRHRGAGRVRAGGTPRQGLPGDSAGAGGAAPALDPGGRGAGP